MTSNGGEGGPKSRSAKTLAIQAVVGLTQSSSYAVSVEAEECNNGTAKAVEEPDR
jgi:hypothetical protein